MNKYNNTFALKFSAALKAAMAEAAQRKTETTLNNMRAVWRSYIVYLRDVMHCDVSSLSIESFSEESARDFVSYLKSKGNKPQSINQKISTIRAILKEVGCSDNQFRCLSMAWAQLHPLKTPKGYRDDVLTLDQVKEIMTVISKEAGTTGIKYYTMIQLAYYTAARIDELLSLRMKDVHLTDSNPHISVMGKGRKVRYLPIDKTTVKNIKRYLKFFFENDFENSDFIFHKVGDKSQKLSAQGVNAQLKKIAVKCHGVPATLHFHQFRKARATHLLDNKMPIEQISEILGHESINTTMTYLGISQEIKLEAINSILPESVRQEERRYPRDITTLLKI